MNVKHLFDVQYSNDEYQNDRTSNCFDVRHSNVESQNDTNVEHQTVLTFNIQMTNVKLFFLIC